MDGAHADQMPCTSCSFVLQELEESTVTFHGPHLRGQKRHRKQEERATKNQDVAITGMHRKKQEVNTSALACEAGAWRFST